MSQKKKTEFLQIRITPEDKQLIKTGADLAERELSEYIREKALTAAQEEINKYSIETKVMFSPEEWKNVLHIMEKPAPYNARLQKAFEDLDKLESQSEDFPLENWG